MIYNKPSTLLATHTGKRVIVSTARGNIIGVLASVAGTDGHPSILHLEGADTTGDPAARRPVDIPWHAVIGITRADTPPPPTVTLAPAAARITDALGRIDTLRDVINADAVDEPDLLEAWRIAIRAHLDGITAALHGPDT